MNRRRPWVAWLVPLCLLVVVPDVASAHDVTGSRFDAPLPLPWLFAGAGGTVAVTALWLAVTDGPTATGRRTLTTVEERTVGWVRAGAGGAFFLGVLAALAFGYAGRQVAAENFATVFTWPVWFRGVGLLAVLLGSPWNALSPWRRLYDGLCRLEGGVIAWGEYPSRLGAWPALAGFLLLVGVVENLTVIPRSPVLTTVVIAVYALVMLAGALLFGPTWFERADPLGVLYRLFGRVAGVATDRSEDGVEISLRPPWQGCTTPVSGPAVVALVVAAVYTVSFDGFTNTRPYQTLLFGVRDALGTGAPTSILLYAVGLLGFVGSFALTALAGDALGAAAGDAPAWRGATRAFAPTVLPIAAAYDVAHNYPYVVRSTARLVEVSAEPLGAGVGSLDPLGWLSLPAFWASQVLLVVAGHVVAVVAAHHVAVERYPSRSAARRGHLPLVVLMVGYTVLSLWIVTQPVVG
jgi:hypothetical protein